MFLGGRVDNVYKEHYWLVTGRAQGIVRINGYKYPLTYHNCVKLNEEGKCSVYDERPGPCRAWPTAHDPLYDLLKDKCTIKITGVRRTSKGKVPRIYKNLP